MEAAANGSVLESTHLSCTSIRMTPHNLEEMMQDPPASCHLVDYPVTSDEESETISV